MYVNKSEARLGTTAHTYCTLQRAASPRSSYVGDQRPMKPFAGFRVGRSGWPAQPSAFTSQSLSPLTIAWRSVTSPRPMGRTAQMEKVGDAQARERGGLSLERARAIGERDDAGAMHVSIIHWNPVLLRNCLHVPNVL